MSNNPIQALPQRCFWVYKTVCVVWTVHTTHTVCIHPKTSLWECLNGIVGHKWTVHTTHTVCIHPKTSLWECLNGTVGHKWTVHTHTLSFGCSIDMGLLDIWTVHLCPTIPFKHSHRDVFEWCIWRQCVWYGQSIYVQQSHSSTPTEMFLGMLQTVCVVWTHTLSISVGVL